MTDETAIALPLHTLYVRLTGLEVPLTLPRVYAWSAWLAQGWTLADLELVIAHKKRTVHPRSRLLAHLAFSNLVANQEQFAESLSLARSASREKHYDPDKAQVLRATHRPVEPESAPARSVDEILRGRNNAAAMLRNLRENL